LGYQWLSERKWSGRDQEKVTTERVGQLIIWRNGEEVYRYDLGQYIAELNAECEARVMASDSAQLSTYRYGCISYGGYSKLRQLDPEAWEFENEQNGVVVHYYLKSWRGDYLTETGESQLSNLEAIALIRWNYSPN